MGRGDANNQLTKLMEDFSKGKIPSPPKNFKFGPLLAVGGMIGTGMVLYQSIYVVNGGHKAIKFNIFTGLSKSTYEPGLHFCVPFIETPITYDCRAKAFELHSKSGSKDLQRVEMGLRVLHKPGTDLVSLHRKLGPQYDGRLMTSVGNEVMKAVIAQYNVSELLTKREQVSSIVREEMVKRCRNFDVDLEDVSIVNLTFGDDYKRAVERKQIAAQEVQRAGFVLEQAKQDKRSKIVLAEGEAESAKIVGQALKDNNSYLQLRQMQVAQETAEIIAGSKNPSIIMDSNLISVGVPQPTTTKSGWLSWLY